MSIKDILKGPHIQLITDQSGKFKIAHDSIKEMAREALFTFTPDHFELAGKDTPGTVMVKYIVSAESIKNSGGLYECSVPSLKVGIDPKIFADNLRCVNPSDTWSLIINAESPTKIFMTSSNEALHKTMCWETNVIEVPDVDIFHQPFADYNFSCMIMYNAVIFHDMMKDLSHSESNIARICCDGNRLVVYSKGIINSASFEISDGIIDGGSTEKADKAEKDAEGSGESSTKKKKAADKYIFEVKDKDLTAWPFCDSYHLKVLEKATKAKGFSTSIKIYLKRRVPSGFPIAICYENILGTLQFFITPQDDEDWVPYEERKMPLGLISDPDKPSSSDAEVEDGVD